ncbi:hypothetical protein NDI56_15730 [Haloarcula sp. S1CR25-12]|uniref:Uncharacterized protein n=1 Tax=Haloarcula saliterrae TaxID=2950534 RepID=A0ABU2FGL5_9EURY|nr:hypothetical protein [Haloarcula sp. S1CR25-12]MDS0260855.1 hypothetical protein [Haloarcula sp. S1CR25-12]
MSQQPPFDRREEQSEQQRVTGAERRQPGQQPPPQQQPSQQQPTHQQQQQPPQQQPPHHRLSRQQPPQRQPQQQPTHQQPQQQSQQRQPSQQRASSRNRQGAQRGGTGGAQKVEQGDEYVHVRFRDPDAFETIRTPDWAAHAAQDIAPGAEVRTGKLKGSGEWHTESVLIPTPVDRQTAVQLANRIVRKIGE